MARKKFLMPKFSAKILAIFGQNFLNFGAWDLGFSKFWKIFKIFQNFGSKTGLLRSVFENFQKFSEIFRKFLKFSIFRLTRKNFLKFFRNFWKFSEFLKNFQKLRFSTTKSSRKSSASQNWLAGKKSPNGDFCPKNCPQKLPIAAAGGRRWFFAQKSWKIHEIFGPKNHENHEFLVQKSWNFMIFKTSQPLWGWLAGVWAGWARLARPYWAQ